MVPGDPAPATSARARDSSSSSQPLSGKEDSPSPDFENRHHHTHQHHHHPHHYHFLQQQNQDSGHTPPTQQSNACTREKEKEYDRDQVNLKDHGTNEGADSDLTEYFHKQGSPSLHLGQHPPSAASTPILHDGDNCLHDANDISLNSRNTTQDIAPANSTLKKDDVVIKSSVKKPVDTDAPCTLRHRKSNRKTHGSRISEESVPRLEESAPTSSEARTSLEAAPPASTSLVSGRIAAPVALMQRKPSLSSMRDHVPANIRTTDQQLTFKLSVEGASPSPSSPRKRASILAEKLSAFATEANTPFGRNEDDFDWGEDNVEDEPFVDPSAVIQDDVSFRIHPFISKVFKNVTILVIFMIPKFILHHVHSHHHDTIVLIEDGRPYVGVVVGNHIAYFVIRFLVMGLFKLIHRFGSVAAKITLETHDGLVPYVARSVWLMNLITFWAIFVHYPTCLRATTFLEMVIQEGGTAAAVAETETNGGSGGVELQCRRWVFWWVYRFLWGAQAMLVLYIVKRYTMQVLSDRFEQDNSKYVELNFQGHVLDGLQKIKHPMSKAYHSGSHYPGGVGGLKNPAAWLVKSTPGSVAGGVMGPCSGSRSPAPASARPFSAFDRRPSTATIVAEDVSLENQNSPKRSLWMLLKSSFRRRKHKKGADSTEIEANGSRAVSEGGDEKPSTSPSESIHETESDHTFPEPQELVRMSRKRKSRLVNSLRNKPIDNPNKKAKELWNRICPFDQRHLVRADLQPAFKKEIFERVWKLFDPSGGETIDPAMFKKGIVDLVNLRKSFTSAHKTFENAMAKLDMLLGFVVFLISVIAFLIAFDAGVQQYAVGVSSLFVGCAFITGSSAKNAFDSMIFIFVMRPYDVGDRIELNGSYFTILTIHILTTEMKRNDGMQVLSPNYLLGTRHIHNLSRAGDHIDNVVMDVPLFSSARTIQRLKQKIQTFIEGEASADYFKIDVILNATSNLTKEGTKKAGLQILFRVHHRNRWIDPDFSPRKLKSILFLRATLSELELEDLKDLIEVRRSLGYGIAPLLQETQNPVLNEAGYPVGFGGTSGNVHDSPSSRNRATQGVVPPISEFYPPAEIASRVYRARDDPTVDASPSSVDSLLSHGSLRSTTHLRENERDHANVPRTLPATAAQREPLQEARHVLVPETIQLSTNAANFQPYPNGFQFQR